MNFLRISAAFLCLASAITPLFYGVYNLGVVALLFAALLLFFFPALMKWLVGHLLLRRLFLLCLTVGITAVAVISSLMIKQAYFTKPPDVGPYTVIVLGAKIVGTQPSLMLRRRLDIAYQYMQLNPQATCIVTGGQGPDEEATEASVMMAYLADRGISPDRIQQEGSSVNTSENLRFAKEILPGDSQGTVIVTDGFHQLRASIFAQQKGLEPIYGLSSLTPWGLIPVYWVRDVFGVVVAWFGWQG